MKKYRNDYRKKGNRYEYTGQWYRTRLSEQDLRKTVLSSMILGILALGFYIGGMCLNNDGGRVAWVLLPFVFQLLPVAYVIAGSGALYLRIRQNGENTSALVEIPQAHKKDLSRADYEKQVKRPWRCSLGILILGCGSFVSDLIFIFLDPKQRAVSAEYLFAADSFVLILFGIILTVNNRKIKGSFEKLS